MSLRLVVEPEAEAEIIAAAAWYEAIGKFLATGFLDAVYTALESVQRNPYQYQRVFRQIRRVTLQRYPYGLFYLATEQEAIVVACLHGRQDPKRWQARLR